MSSTEESVAATVMDLINAAPAVAIRADPDSDSVVVVDGGYVGGGKGSATVPIDGEEDVVKAVGTATADESIAYSKDMMLKICEEVMNAGLRPEHLSREFDNAGTKRFDPEMWLNSVWESEGMPVHHPTTRYNLKKIGSTNMMDKLTKRGTVDGVVAAQQDNRQSAAANDGAAGGASLSSALSVIGSAAVTTSISLGCKGDPPGSSNDKGRANYFANRNKNVDNNIDNPNSQQHLFSSGLRYDRSLWSKSRDAPHPPVPTKMNWWRRPEQHDRTLSSASDGCRFHSLIVGQDNADKITNDNRQTSGGGGQGRGGSIYRHSSSIFSQSHEYLGQYGQHRNGYQIGSGRDTMPEWMNDDLEGGGLDGGGVGGGGLLFEKPFEFESFEEHEQRKIRERNNDEQKVSKNGSASNVGGNGNNIVDVDNTSEGVDDGGVGRNDENVNILNPADDRLLCPWRDSPVKASTLMMATRDGSTNNAGSKNNNLPIPESDKDFASLFGISPAQLDAGIGMLFPFMAGSVGGGILSGIGGGNEMDLEVPAKSNDSDSTKLVGKVAGESRFSKFFSSTLPMKQEEEQQQLNGKLNEAKDRSKADVGGENAANGTTDSKWTHKAVGSALSSDTEGGPDVAGGPAPIGNNRMYNNNNNISSSNNMHTIDNPYAAYGNVGLAMDSSDRMMTKLMGSRQPHYNRSGEALTMDMLEQRLRMNNASPPTPNAKIYGRRQYHQQQEQMATIVRPIIPATSMPPPNAPPRPHPSLNRRSNGGMSKQQGSAAVGGLVTPSVQQMSSSTAKNWNVGAMPWYPPNDSRSRSHRFTPSSTTTAAAAADVGNFGDGRANFGGLVDIKNWGRGWVTTPKSSSNNNSNNNTKNKLPASHDRAPPINSNSSISSSSIFNMPSGTTNLRSSSSSSTSNNKPSSNKQDIVDDKSFSSNPYPAYNPYRGNPINLPPRPLDHHHQRLRHLQQSTSSSYDNNGGRGSDANNDIFNIMNNRIGEPNQFRCRQIPQFLKHDLQQPQHHPSSKILTGGGGSGGFDGHTETKRIDRHGGGDNNNFLSANLPPVAATSPAQYNANRWDANRDQYYHAAALAAAAAATGQNHQNRYGSDDSSDKNNHSLIGHFPPASKAPFPLIDRHHQDYYGHQNSNNKNRLRPFGRPASASASNPSLTISNNNNNPAGAGSGGGMTPTTSSQHHVETSNENDQLAAFFAQLKTADY